MTMKSPPILVLGMHRSGTSYLASLLRAMGAEIGHDLLGAANGNPHGHFEDRELVEFHERLLRQRALDDPRMTTRTTMVTRAFDGRFGPDERREAQALLQSRASKAPWGWKDPRTALFIDGWKTLCPDLRGIVIYRHPWAVHDSLLRRDHWELFIFPLQVLRSYAVYNRALIRAIRRDRSHFLVLHADSAFANFDRLMAQLREFASLPSEKVEPPPFYRSEFRARPLPSFADEALRWLVPDAIDAFAELDELADLPAAPYVEAADPDGWRHFAELRNLCGALGKGAESLALPLVEALVLGRGKEGLVGDRWQLARRFCEDHNGKTEWIESLIEDNTRIAAELEHMRSTCRPSKGPDAG